MKGSIVKIDTKEPDHILSMDFDECLCYPSSLKFGDVEITTPEGHTVLIERKTPSDLLGSIADGRVFKQVAGMKESTPYVYIIVTGTLYRTGKDKVQVDGRETGWAWSSVQGALATIQELGAVVVYCKNDAEFPKTVELIANRKRGEEKILPPASKARGVSDAEHFISSLPGIGINRAMDLLRDDAPPAYALVWLTELNTIAKVAGIGNGTKTKVRKALGLEDGQELGIYCPKVAAQREERKQKELQNG